jgi:hypothetical protein
MIATVAELYLAEGRPTDAVKLATFLIHYPGTWHETKERASDLTIKSASRMASPEFTRAQEIGRQIEFDQVLDKLAFGDIQHLCS